jgi:sugar/nucleoside kinase (ribokinase family)
MLDATNAFESVGLVKGAMNLIPLERAHEIYSVMRSTIQTSGGSVANTIAGVAGLGGTAGFVGKVARDEFGDVFRHDLQTLGAEVSLSYTDPADVETGRCHVFVTDDAQRTMATYLGAAQLLEPADIDTTLFARSDIAYLEGYLFDLPPAKEAMRKAIAATHEADGLVAISLSDSFCVERHRRDFLQLVTGEVDILIANHLEAMSLFQVDTLEDVFAHLDELGILAVVTDGPRGSWVTTISGAVHVPAPEVPDDRVVDQNGAGDVFAAGFLYGLTDGADPVEAVRLGSLCAGEIITHMGPRAVTDLRELAEHAGLL